jgi:NAD(P)-dependent dehydrogenase (short-subunit alcohol dehydrogenase family)
VRLAQEGADIIAFDRCEPEASTGYPLGSWAELVETGAMVEQHGRRCHIARADVRDRSALRTLFEETASSFPRLDIIIANAAISSCDRFLDYSHEDWEEIIAVNLTGVFSTVQTFVPRMVTAGNGGSVVLVGSVAGLKAVPFCAPYVAAKHGVNGLVKVLAVELGEHGIRVNSVNPGAVETPMTTDRSFVEMTQKDPVLSDVFSKSWAPVLPLPRSGMVQPTAISDAVAWLASDDSRWVTGASIPVDAGVTVR